MAYIVDGNNVIGQTPGWHRDKSNARRRLVEDLVPFARANRTRVAVVFDGEPDPLMPDGSAIKGVKVMYSKRGSDADSRIIGLVEASPDPRGLTVVTSDRALAFSVKSAGARVVRSGEFRRRLQQSDRTYNRSEDGEDYRVDDIDSWYRYFGATPED